MGTCCSGLFKMHGKVGALDCIGGRRSNEPHFMRGFQVSAFAGTDSSRGQEEQDEGISVSGAVSGWIQRHPLSSAP